MSEWLLFSANSAIFQLRVYHDENKLILNEMMMMRMRSILYKTNMLSWILIVLGSLKQQSLDRHVTPLEHIILIPSLNQSALSS